MNGNNQFTGSYKMRKEIITERVIYLPKRVAWQTCSIGIGGNQPKKSKIIQRKIKNQNINLKAS